MASNRLLVALLSQTGFMLDPLPKAIDIVKNVDAIDSLMRDLEVKTHKEKCSGLGPQRKNKRRV